MPPCEWCKFGQVFKGKTGACQTAQNGPMLNFFGQNCLESNFNGGHFNEKKNIKMGNDESNNSQTHVR